MSTLVNQTPMPAIRASSWRHENSIWYLGDYRVYFSTFSRVWLVHAKDQLVAESVTYTSSVEARKATERLIESSPAWQAINRTWYRRNYAVSWNPDDCGWTIYHFQAALANNTYQDPENAKHEVDCRLALQDNAATAQAPTLPLAAGLTWQCLHYVWYIGDYKVFFSAFLEAWVLKYKQVLLTETREPNGSPAPLMFQALQKAKDEVERRLSPQAAPPIAEVPPAVIAWQYIDDIWQLGDYKIYFSVYSGLWEINYKNELLIESATTAGAVTAGYPVVQQAYPDRDSAKRAVEARLKNEQRLSPQTAPPIAVENKVKSPTMNPTFHNVWDIIAQSVQWNRRIEIQQSDGTWLPSPDFDLTYRDTVDIKALKTIFCINKLRLQPRFFKKACWIVMRYRGMSIFNVSESLDSVEVAETWINTHAAPSERQDYYIAKIVVEVTNDDVL